MAAFLGKAYVAYLPTNKVVGISKLARVVEIFSRRLQTQETLTQQIADSIFDSLRPQGVAVLIDAEHQCMTTRGINHRHVSTITTQFTGVFKTDRDLQKSFPGFLQPALSRSGPSPPARRATRTSGMAAPASQQKPRDRPLPAGDQRHPQADALVETIRPAGHGQEEPFERDRRRLRRFVVVVMVIIVVDLARLRPPRVFQLQTPDPYGPLRDASISAGGV